MSKGSLKALPPDLSRPREGIEPKTAEWAAWVREVEDYLGYKVCGRRTARKTPCPKRPIKGRDCCAKHGGKTLRGPAHPNWIDGRASLYAEVLPQNIYDKYEKLVNDPKLLALDSDIAMLELHQLDIYKSFREGMDPAKALEDILEEIVNLRVAVAKGDVIEVGLSAEAIAEKARGGKSTAEAWEEFMNTAERKRKLVETEQKRLERMRVTLTAEEARMRDQMIINILLRAVATHVTNEKEGRAVLRDIVESVGRLSGTLPDPRMLPNAVEVGRGQ